MVTDIVANTAIAQISKSGQKLINPASLCGDAEVFVEQLKIRCSSIHQPLSTLSGGNQQKVVLAKWFNTEPDIYIFDEPTRGIDIGAKEDIYHLMIDLLKQGKSIIMVSSDLPEEPSTTLVVNLALPVSPSVTVPDTITLSVVVGLLEPHVTFDMT